MKKYFFREKFKDLCMFCLFVAGCMKVLGAPDRSISIVLIACASIAVIAFFVAKLLTSCVFTGHDWMVTGITTVENDPHLVERRSA